LEPLLLERLVVDPLVLERVKVEALLATSMGLRPSSQVTIPAELPGGASMGREIDQRALPHLEEVKSILEPRERLKAIQGVKKVLASLFEEVVEASPEYEALMGWAKELGLRVNQVEVRPTVHEVYLYRDRSTGRALRKLMGERNRIRRRVQRRPGMDTTAVRFAYPEEFQEEWVRGLGRLLGYPQCCVDRYARERVQGVNVEERASRQLKEAQSEGAVDPYAYYTAYFFPCSPSCPEASKLGREWLQAFQEADPRLGELYKGVLQENLERVLRQPEEIRRYLEMFRRRG